MLGKLALTTTMTLALLGLGNISYAGNKAVQSRECRSLGTDCYSDSFTSPNIKQTPLDLLLVVDTSVSMNQEMPGIQTAIAQFVGGLPGNMDLNLAVMLSHGSTSAWSGRLFQAAGEPTVLKGRALTVAQMQAHLRTKLNGLVSDAGSAGGEEGMFSLFNGITNTSLLSESRAAGFFRNNASLAVVFISDDRDICAIVPAGVPQETDPVKLAARVRDCEGLTAQGLSSRLQALKGNQALYTAGIIYSSNPVPAGDNEIGYGYTNVIAQTSGTIIELGRDNITAKLQTIVTNAGVGSVAQYTLTHQNVDPGSVVVIANGRQVAFTLNGNVVTLQEVLPPGTLVVINYCVTGNQLGSKAAKLAAIMSMSCQIYNKSFPKNYVAPSAAEVTSRLRACTPEIYPETPTTTKQQRTLDQLLDTEDGRLRHKLFHKLWYNPPASDHFEYYFGLGINEAVRVFCLRDPYLPEQLATKKWIDATYAEAGSSWFHNPTEQAEWRAVQTIRKQLNSCLNK